MEQKVKASQYKNKHIGAASHVPPTSTHTTINHNQAHHSIIPQTVHTLITIIKSQSGANTLTHDIA